MTDVPLNVKLVAAALIKAGEEADLATIYDHVARLDPSVRARYKNRESFEGTVRATLESHCPQSENYTSGNEAIFEKVSKGRYRVVYPGDRNEVIKRGLSSR